MPSSVHIMSVDTIKAELNQLIQDKQLLETRIECETTGAVPNEVLVDTDGYPRNDIDIHSIRISRHNLIQLQNDYKQLMKLIDNKMIQYHTLLKQKPPNTDTTCNKPLNIDIISPDKPVTQPSTNIIKLNNIDNNSIPPPQQSVLQLQPFYTVNTVSPDSPAELSGLQPNDNILQFGSITSYNKTNTAMTDLVSNNIGQSINVIVERINSDNVKQRLTLRLIPQQWSGRGLLGCHLIDYVHSEHNPNVTVQE